MATPVVEKLIRPYVLARFFVRQRIFGFSIDDEPFIEPEAKQTFAAMLRESRFYLEYGSGGSTVMAARMNKRFLSVETDPYYLRAVREKIGALAPHQRLIHADVGLTGPWGTPFFRRVTPRRLAQWTNYLEAPWRLIPEDDLPDLILIDGRFRVAAALTCCLHLVGSRDSRILVDDYEADRNYYPIEQYARLTSKLGRMAIFQTAPQVTADQLRAAIATYATDCR